MDISALLLADSRFPGGGHVHSGGLEEAAARAQVSNEDDLAPFLLGRLRTAGELAAVFAAAATHAARRNATPTFWATLDAELDARTPSPAQRDTSRTQGAATLRAAKATFAHTDLKAISTPPAAAKATFSPPAAGTEATFAPAAGTEATFAPAGGAEATFAPAAAAKATFAPAAGMEATFAPPAGAEATFTPASAAGMEATFTPAPATGATFAPAAARATFVPADLKATFGGVVAGLGARPHHAIVLGAVVGAAGGLPVDAALTAAYLSVSGPASAAVRLLGLDPFAVNGVVVALSEWMRDVAERAAECAARDPAELPAPAAPGLDLLAEAHRRHHEKEVRLFAS